jgi:hypothetical protein
MPDNDSDGGVARLQDFTDDLARRLPPMEASPLADRPIEDVSSHDFAFHEYVFPTETGFRFGGLSDGALERVDRFQTEYLAPHISSALWEVYTRMLTEVLVTFERSVRQAIAPHTALSDPNTLFQAIVEPVYRDDAFWYPVISQRLGDLSVERQAGRPLQYLQFLEGTYLLYVGVKVVDLFPNLADTWLDWEPYYVQNLSVYQHYNRVPASPSAHPGDDYKFEVFPESSVNLGLRLIYRQSWRALGAQKGEVVRTITLAPGQKERVATKVVRRRKSARTLESSSETETTRETTETTKDSSEVVAEAADMFKWNVDAKVSGGFLDFFSAEVGTSFGGSSEEKRKETNSFLSEAMQKAASKIRRETKTLVSTEAEESFESEVSSEIVNPNGEMAMTCEYHKLQQQYEVFTYLAEVRPVVFVAEHLPSPNEITDDWVRRHDWILARALKDESFRPILNEISREVEELAPPQGSTPYESMFSAAVANFARFEHTAPGGEGLSIPDIYAEPQRLLREHLREEQVRDRTNRMRRAGRERLLRHIKDNILHYARAVWESEDADQRILRYKREDRRVPVEWLIRFRSGPVRLRVRIEHEPTGLTAPLWDLLDPTGPLGYAGNYAVFALRPTDATPHSDPNRVNLDGMLGLMRSRYVGADGLLRDPALKSFRRIADALSASRLAQVNDTTVEDLLSYLPRLEPQLLDAEGNVRRAANGDLLNPISRLDWAEYLYRKNGTRRFLLDSNNLYLSLRLGAGVALEPFKRAHRYVDVLKAHEELVAMEHQNERRATHLLDAGAFDPDVEKVIVVGDGNEAAAATAVAATTAGNGKRRKSAAPARSSGSSPEATPGDGASR